MWSYCYQTSFSGVFGTLAALYQCTRFLQESDKRVSR